MMRMRSLVLAAALIALSASAQAQWLEGDQTDNPFEKTKAHWVFTAVNTTVFGFSCDGPDSESARLVFLTPERAEAAEAATLNLLKPQLSIIIDDGERADLVAQIDTVEILGASRLRVVASGPPALAIVNRLSQARRRVSVALSAVAKTWHATNFGVRGSAKVLRKALDTCGVAAPGAPT